MRLEVSSVKKITLNQGGLFVYADSMYYVYLLFSHKDKRLYIGYTNDLKRRIHEHKTGSSQATKNRLPLSLIYYECYLTSFEAERRERYLKGGNGRTQIKTQLSETLKRVGYKFR